jgi:molybdenum cofactor guanylyltransferase
MTRPACVILAGGQARRMGGRDKPLLPLAGRSLLDHLLAALDGQAAPIALSANGDPARFARFGLPVLPDARPGLGPLAGILAGLDWASASGATALLSVPGDTPFLPPDLARRLAPAPAFAAGHPPIALWPVAARPTLAAFLERDPKRRLRDALAALAARAVDFPGHQFADADTPEDLARLSREAAAPPCR